ncbi:MAG: phosphoribosylaminoimidazolesuccinocarboxamide synthase [Alphaproteobacteria bacterium]|jgi:phosphoribosylaminoimidazole-succinocarboxamide synthase|nr:phosphoribosylaminoimidazolesuccinocarboxamide synthase [Alphaproteobacteria bacterium]MDP6818892.1 phosphoribosylaminoimidazolesuccinocarboxamide synthase [Alphaproteobacteria bacterium]
MNDSNLAPLSGQCLTDAHFPELPGFYRGKVRDTYRLPDGRQVMIATDRQSAFDKVLAAVPHKGQVLNQTARFWFEATSDICPNHVLSYPDPNTVIARHLEMMPIEMIVRDYMTGSTETSIWTMYQRGERLLYGHRFADGLVKNQKLPETILTPTTKGARDAPITAAEIVAEKLLSQEQWDAVAEISFKLFARGREIAARHGLILVDTKYEFGTDAAGRITIADELHTPDSSRYWKQASYAERLAAGEEPEALDKEFLRLWVRERCDPYTEPVPDIPEQTLREFSRKYIALYEAVTGQAFEYSAGGAPVRERIRANLARALPEYFA